MFGQAAFTEYATRLIPQAPVELNHDLLDFTGESPWNRTKLCQVKSLMPRAGRPTTQNCGGELAGSAVFEATVRILQYGDNFVKQLYFYRLRVSTPN